MSSQHPQQNSSTIIFDYQQEHNQQPAPKRKTQNTHTHTHTHTYTHTSRNKTIRQQDKKPIQIQANIIKVKSTPRIRNRNKIHVVPSQDSQRNHKNRNVKKLVFQEQEQQQEQQQDSEYSNQKQEKQSIRDTKPTKTVEEHQADDNEYNNNSQQRQYERKQGEEQDERKQGEEQYDSEQFEYKLYSRHKPVKQEKISSPNVIPCKAKRQLGNSDDEPQDEQISQKQQQYESSQQQPQINPKPMPKPSINLKFSPTQLPSFFSTPLPPAYQFQSYVHLDQSFFNLGNRYNLKQKYQNKVIISAKKQMLTFNTKVLLSLDQKNHSRRNRNFMGVMEGNFGGTQWVLKCPILSMRFGEGEVCEEMRNTMVVRYRSSVLGSQSCRQMRVLIINPQTPKKHHPKLQPQLTPQNSHNLLKNPNILQLYTAKPILTKGRYTIDFHGLAKQASSKNFILQTKQGKQCLILAKQSQNVYALNIRYPFNVMQGFALALASLNSKLLVN